MRIRVRSHSRNWLGIIRVHSWLPPKSLLRRNLSPAWFWLYCALDVRPQHHWPDFCASAARSGVSQGAAVSSPPFRSGRIGRLRQPAFLRRQQEYGASRATAGQGNRPSSRSNFANFAAIFPEKYVRGMSGVANPECRSRVKMKAT